MAKVFMSQPGFNGMIHQKTLQSMRGMSREHEVDYKFIENASLIPHARSNHLSLFYHLDHDYLLTIDNDMAIGPMGCLDEMIAKAPKDSIIGGFYSKKAHDLNGHGVLNGKLLQKQPVVLDGRIMECESMPTGFLLTPRSVIEKMIKAYPELEYDVDDTYLKSQKVEKGYALYHCILENKVWYSEDYSFCKRARNIGIKIYADCGVIIGHIGNTNYNLYHLIPNGGHK